MAHIKIDTQAYDLEVNEHSDSKDGYFGFDSSELTVTIGFKADEHGNVESLSVIQAWDAYGNDTSYTIDDSNYNAIKEQIEPQLWGESDAYETEHGLRNSDFISAWA